MHKFLSWTCWMEAPFNIEFLTHLFYFSLILCSYIPSLPQVTEEVFKWSQILWNYSHKEAESCPFPWIWVGLWLLPPVECGGSDAMWLPPSLLLGCWYSEPPCKNSNYPETIMLMLEVLWLTAPAEPLPKCQTCQQDAMSPADQLSFPQIPPSDPKSMPRGA